MNDAWVFPTLVWYEVSGFREIEESMGINNLFTCVILQKDDEFIDHSYVLSLRESIDSYVLIVDEKREGDFVRRVLPKIECFFTEDVKLCSIEEVLS
ncbi:hypothetical protein [Paenibacillus oleatilyticus]|uniref:hypothetical protein n=1 Tax=Paenibacillus oleatilyticus TaxID=2594886 RepID=UPI001C1F52C4|nr:hypothetical protein [Paenibacillus oleatilyticus]MBU7315018.1 hypothetical protein [Paenibacillus oleatilyticus]